MKRTIRFLTVLLLVLSIVIGLSSCKFLFDNNKNDSDVNSGNSTDGGNDNFPDDGDDNFPDDGDDNHPSGDDNPPSGDDNPPSGDDNPPGGDDTPPSGDDNPPIGDDNPPSGDDNPPGGDDNPPSGDDNPDHTHNYSVYVGVSAEATCSTNRFDLYKCEICEEVQTVEVADSIVDHIATDLQIGTEYCGDRPISDVYCKFCSLHMGTFGHEYVRSVEPPTCYEPGGATYTCLYCGDSYTESVSAIGHIPGAYVVEAESTCTSGGTVVSICVLCDEIVDRRETEAIDHFYVSEIEGNQIIYTCSYCSDCYNERIESAVYTVHLETIGGDRVSDVAVLAGGVPDLPMPKKEGHIFAGWYYDTSYNEPYSGREINSDLTLYAKWYEIIEEEVHDYNCIVTDTDPDFTFEVVSDIPLNGQNVGEHVIIQDISKNVKTPIVKSVDGNTYTIACSEYEEGKMYSITLSEDVRFTDEKVEKISLHIKGEQRYEVILKDDIIKVPISEIFAIIELDEGYRILCKEDILNKGDKVVFCSTEGGENCEFGAEVHSCSVEDGMYAYDVTGLELEEMFDEYDVNHSGVLDFTNVVIDETIEDDIKAALMDSEAYAHFSEAARLVAKKRGMSLSNPEVDFSWAGTNEYLIVSASISLKMSTKDTVNAINDVRVTLAFVWNISVADFYEQKFIRTQMNLITNIDTTVSLDASVGGRTYNPSNIDDVEMTLLVIELQNEIMKLKKSNVVVDPLTVKDNVKHVNVNLKSIPIISLYDQIKISVDIDLEFSFGMTGIFGITQQTKTTSIQSVSATLRQKKFYKWPVIDVECYGDTSTTYRAVAGYMYSAFDVMAGASVNLNFKLSCLTASLGVVLGVYADIGGHGAVIDTPDTHQSNGAYWITIGIRSQIRISGGISIVKWLDAFTTVDWYSPSLNIPVCNIGDDRVPFYFNDTTHNSPDNPQILEYKCTDNVVIDLNTMVDTELVWYGPNKTTGTSSEWVCEFNYEFFSLKGAGIKNVYCIDNKVMVVEGIGEVIVRLTVTYDNLIQKNVYLKVIIAHDFSKAEVSEDSLRDKAFCTIPTTYWYTCACGEKSDSEYFTHGELGDHNFSEWFPVKPSLCTDIEEYEERICYFCGTVESSIDVIHGHSYLITRVEPTCTENGYKTTSCDRCGEVFDERIIEATGHTLGIESIDPEYHYEKCYNEGCDHYEAIPHKVEIHVSCESDGYCSICGWSVEEKTGHKWSDDYRYNNAEHWRYCTNEGCREHYRESEHYGGKATCTEQAVCKVCSAPYGDLLEHSYDIMVITPEYLASSATCIKKAKYYYSCSCGAKSDNTFEYGVFADHVYSSWVNAKAPGCETEGNIKYREYSVCKAVFDENYNITDKYLIPPIGHSWGEWQYSNDNTHYRKCINNSIHVEEGKCDGTSKVIHDATCTKSGYKLDECKYCLHTVIHVTEAPLGHDYKYTTDNEGNHTVKCTRCSYNVIEKCAFSIEKTAPTCEDNGVIKYTCSECEYSYSELGEMAHGHSFTVKNTAEKYLAEEATCCDLAKYYYSCIHCDAIGEETFKAGEYKKCPNPTEWVYIGDDNHKATCEICGRETVKCCEIKETVVAPTCTEDGYIEKTCRVCGHYRKTITEAPGHNYADDYISENGCHYRICNACGKDGKREDCFGGTATCLEKAVCSICKSKYGEYGDHSEIITVPEKPATCTENGNEEYKYCSLCKEEITKRVVIKAPGHTSDNIVVENKVDPTCTSQGYHYEVKYCKNCSQEFSRVRVTDLELPHDWLIPKCCTDDKICKRCGASEQYRADHVYWPFSFTPAKEPTCTEEGWDKYQVCSSCLHSTKVIKSPLGHSWQDATCTNPKTCSVCSETEGNALGHLWSDWNKQDSEDEHYKRCERCKIVDETSEGPCFGGTADCYERARCEVCDHYYGALKHSPGPEPTCTDAQVCTICNATIEKAIGHSFSEGWTQTNNQHYRTCTNSGCNAVSEKNDCSGGTATCMDLAKCSICSNTYGSKSPHTYIEEVEDEAHLKDAGDCQTYQVYWKNCKNCDSNAKYDSTAQDQYFRSIIKKGDHNYSNEWDSNGNEHFHSCTVSGCIAKTDSAGCSGGAATCTERAVCDVCDNHYGNTAYKLSDKWISGGDGTHYKQCTYCLGAVNGHDKVNIALCNGDPVTCTEDSVCKACHYVIERALGHDFGELIPELPAACESKGMKAHYVCSRCAQYFNESYEQVERAELTIKELGHRYTKEIPTQEYVKKGCEATCYSLGEYYYACDRCETFDKDKSGTYIGGGLVPHKYNSWISCGYDDHHRYCSVCKNEEIQPHSRVATQIVSPTCTELGYTEYECRECKQKHGTDDYVDPLGHDPSGKWIPIEGDEYERVYHYQLCTRSGCSYVCVKDFHTTKIIGVDTTTMENGLKIHAIVTKCEDCGKEWQDKSPVTECEKGDPIDRIEPTCVKPGYTDGLKCIHGDVMIEPQPIPPLGCEYDLFGICVRCGEKFPSTDLDFILSTDKTYYIVIGIGGCKDDEVIIPSLWEGLPVKQIADDAFVGQDFTSVVIRENITEIGARAFKGCTNLVTITIYGDVTEIGHDAFESCSALSGVHIKDLSAWCAIEFAENETMNSNPLKKAGKLYLNEELISLLLIPEGVASITSGAFIGCDHITEVIIPESLTYISEIAFDDSTVNRIYYCGNASEWEQNVTFSSYNEKVITIYYYSETEPNEEGNFWHYVDGEPAVWPEYIPPYSTGLEYTLSSDDTYYIVSGIGDCTDTDIIIPSAYNGLPVKEIGNSAFKACTSFVSITIPDSVTSIGDYAFASCSSLTSVTIGNGVTSIGGYAFEYCSRFESVHITDIVAWCNIDFGEFGGYYSGDVREPSNNPLCYANKLYLNGELVTDLVIPEGVTRISDAAFAYTSFTSVTIPCSLRWIGGYAFKDCTITNLHISDIQAWCNLKFEMTCEYEGSYDDAPHEECYSSPWKYAENLYLNGELLTDLVIPEGVTRIEMYHFDGCTSITGITIPESVTYIGNGAFYNCTNVEKIVYNATDATLNTTWYDGGIYDSSYVYCIAFANVGVNTSGVSVTIGKNVTKIPDHLFAYRCYSDLEDDWIEWGLRDTNVSANIVSVEFEARSVCKNIGENAFYGCSYITDVYYNGTSDEWAEIAIADGNNDLTNATIHYAHIHDYSVKNTSDEYLVLLGTTCLENHVYYYSCECGKAGTETFEEGCGEHQYTEDFVNANPCYGGVITYTCRCCDYVMYVEVAARGHVYENGLCVDCGYKCDIDIGDPGDDEIIIW